MPDLRLALNALATTFADGVLAAIRAASIEDLVDEATGRSAARPSAQARAPRTTNGSPSTRPAATPATTAARTAPAKKTKAGPLKRRSPAEIEATLARVVGLVRKTTGMRAEEIQKGLGLDRREMPRVLKHGLSTKKLKSKGIKRATMYSAA